MSIRNKLKKYFLADLTEKQDSFSLGNWEVIFFYPFTQAIKIIPF